MFGGHGRIGWLRLGYGNGHVAVYSNQNCREARGNDGIFAAHIEFAGRGHLKWERPHATSARWAPGPGENVLIWPYAPTRAGTAAASSGRRLITTFGPASPVAAACTHSCRQAVPA